MKKESMLFDVGQAKARAEQPEVRPIKIDAPDMTKPLPFESLTGATFDETRKYRYSLLRKIGTGTKTILWIAANPSTADETTDDSTVRRIIDFSRRWGYAKIYVANLFAFCATEPRRMKRAADPVGPKNNWWLAELNRQTDMCVLCCGNLGLYRHRMDEVRHLLEKLGPLYCLGVTKRGCPRHPLYLRKDTPLVEWRP
jgi:hypothetical protein